MAHILHGHAIAELIKTRGYKDAKQKAKTRNIPKTPGTPKRTKRIHFRKRVLDTNSSSESEDSSHSTANSCSSNSMYSTITLGTPHPLRPICTLCSTPMALRAPLSEASKASEAANMPSPTRSGSQDSRIVISPPKRTLRPRRNRYNSRLHVRI